MKRRKCIFIEYDNKDQVKWWNNIANWLVKTTHYHELVERETNKPVGVFFVIEGILADYVVKKCGTFIQNPSDMTITFDD